MDFIKRQYKLLGDFFRSKLRFAFLCCLAAFGIILVGTWLALQGNPESIKAIMQTIMQMFESKGITSGTEISYFKLLGNNLNACAVSIILGFIPFLYFPALSLALNAGIIGAFAAALKGTANAMLILIVGILPHGILEIPALLLAMSCGILLCTQVIRKLVGQSAPGQLKGMALNALRLYVLVILPLLVVAAAIETYITPQLLQMVL